jgi:peroxiredoxin
MEKNSEMPVNSWGEDRWVEDRLAALRPDSEWQPDTIRGLVRFRELRSAGGGPGRRWILWAAAAVMAIFLCLMAFPSPRVFAHYCLNCSVELWQSLSSSGPVRAGVRPEKKREMAPEFTLSDVSGRPVRLSDFRGKVVLLNFWATWCGGCKVEIPWFIEFANKYKDSGFSVIGVAMDDDGWKSVQPYLEEKKMNYPVVIGTGDLGKRYGLDSMPMTLLIDQSGRIASTHVGLVRKSDYKTEIETLLNRRVAAAVAGSTR